jgi:heme/copper-type cytochrome/quinol oxidase subunit 2
MVDNIIRQTSKKTWYKWSVYINIILFFVVAIMLYFVIWHAYDAGLEKGSDPLGNNTDEMFVLVRDIAILVVAVALLFFQFFKNLFTIMKRSL